MDYRLKMNALSRDQRKTLRQIKSSLSAKIREGTDTSSIVFWPASFQDQTEQLMVFFHREENIRRLRGPESLQDEIPQIFLRTVGTRVCLSEAAAYLTRVKPGVASILRTGAKLGT
jgi:hypothetical protein